MPERSVESWCDSELSVDHPLEAVARAHGVSQGRTTMFVMNEANLDVVVELEERLERAMRTSDVRVLDELLADDLLFTNHQGLVVTKQEDLEVHRSGLLTLDSLVVSDRSIRRLGNVAIVAVRVQLAGRHANNCFEGTFRYTRVWALLGVRWRIVAAHATVVAA